MKKTTVRDILKLKIMDGYRIAAGMAGLLNEIHYINVYDNLPTEIDASIPVFPGDIYLSTLYHGKDNADFITDFIEKLISFKGSALIVPAENIKSLPPKAVSLCDKAKFPVIFIDCKTPYSIIISEIMRYQLSLEHRQSIEDKLHALADSHTSLSEKKEITLQLNPNFQKNAVCLFCQSRNPGTNEIRLNLEDNVKIANHLNNNLHNFAAEYKNGLLVVHTFTDARKAEFSHDIYDMTEFIRQHDPQVIIGISRTHDITGLGAAVSEALSACIAGTADKKGISYFHNIGVTRILAGLDSSKNIEEFYLDVVSPVVEWDKNNNANLFDTMLAFVEQNMNYRAAANMLFVHENTVRYRIEKIRELIPYGNSEMDFYLTISLVVKIYRLKNL